MGINLSKTLSPQNFHSLLMSSGSDGIIRCQGGFMTMFLCHLIVIAKVSFSRRRFSQIMYANVLITFVLSGIWHGANWTLFSMGLSKWLNRYFGKILC